MATQTKSKTAAPAAAEVQNTEPSPAPAAAKRQIVARDIDPNTLVTVRNGFQGKLIYKSRKTGELFAWESFGDEQDMELSELKNARNSAKRFFIDNWFMFDDAWVIDYLGVGRYYRNTIPIDSFDELFSRPAQELEKALNAMPEGQRRSVAYRARQLIREGGIDSIGVISVLEKATGTSLIER